MRLPWQEKKWPEPFDCYICKHPITKDDLLPPAVLMRWGETPKAYAPVCAFCQWRLGLTANSQRFLSRADGKPVDYDAIEAEMKTWSIPASKNDIPASDKDA
jgi:hypothetical protein